MTLRAFRKAWEKFFFAPQSPLPIALFRILYGACVSVTLILLHSDWLDWYGVHCLGVAGDDEDARTRCPSQRVRASAPG